MPLNANPAVPAGRCVRCDNPAAAIAWFAKAY